MFKKVAFTRFPVRDAQRARAFYETTLGFKRGLSSPDGVWTEYDMPGGGCLALARAIALILQTGLCFASGCGEGTDEPKDSAESELESRELDAAVRDSGGRSQEAQDWLNRCHARELPECVDDDGDCVIASAYPYDAEGECFLAETAPIGCVPPFGGGAAISCVINEDGEPWIFPGGGLLPLGWSAASRMSRACSDMVFCE